MDEEAQDEDLRKTMLKAQSGVRSVVYTVVEQVMLDLLRNDIIGETLDARVAKFFDTNEAAEGLSKSQFTLTSFMRLLQHSLGFIRIGQWRTKSSVPP